MQELIHSIGNHQIILEVTEEEEITDHVEREENLSLTHDLKFALHFRRIT